MKNNGGGGACDKAPLRNVTHHCDSVTNTDRQRCFCEIEHQMPSRKRFYSVWRGNALPSSASCCIQHVGLPPSISGRHRAIRAKAQFGKRASNSGTRTLRKRWFDVRVLRSQQQRTPRWKGPRVLRLCSVELCALVVSEGPVSIQTFPFFFKLNHVQLRALGVCGWDKGWFVFAADLFNIKSICF